MVISLDSSGLKVSNRGDWIRKVWKVHRGWIKVHLAVDEEKQCVAIKVTDESVGDKNEFKPLLKEADHNICTKSGVVIQANADGVYDTRDNFNAFKGTGITPAIKIRENASVRSKGCLLRRKHVQEYKRLGYKKWRNKYGYSYRWRVEGNFSAVKRLTGEYVVATKKTDMFKEAIMKFLCYNSIIKHDKTAQPPWVA